MNKKSTEPSDVLVDAKGLSCPMPLLKAKQALNRCEVGQTVKVLATDAGALRDIPAYCQISGHELLYSESAGGIYTFGLKKSGA